MVHVERYAATAAHCDTSTDVPSYEAQLLVATHLVRELLFANRLACARHGRKLAESLELEKEEERRHWCLTASRYQAKRLCWLRCHQ